MSRFLPKIWPTAISVGATATDQGDAGNFAQIECRALAMLGIGENVPEPLDRCTAGTVITEFGGWKPAKVIQAWRFAKICKAAACCDFQPPAKVTATEGRQVWFDK